MEIEGTTSSIAHVKWEIQQRYEEIEKRKEHRRILESFRDFITIKMSEAMAREREKSDRVLQEQLEQERIAIENEARIAEERKVNEVVEKIVRSVIKLDSVSNTHKLLSQKADEIIDLTVDNVAIDKLEKARAEADRREAGPSRGTSKRLIPSIRIQRYKPYKIPKITSLRKKSASSSKLSALPVIVKPILSEGRSAENSRSFSSR